LTGLLDGASNLSSIIETMPSIGDVIAVQICEGTFFLLTSYYIDSLAVIELSPSSSNDDPTFDPSVLENLDEDVTAERVRTATLQEAAPLVVSRLRKVFPPKVSGRSPVVATEDVSFVVNTGEIFGLLGANGAGKTTTLSMLTRHLVPTSGNAFIVNHSILSDFSKGATHLGVVTQV
jgi:ABC-type glutathione transport system ATPase component